MNFLLYVYILLITNVKSISELVVFSNEYDYTAKYNEDPDFYVVTEHIKLSRHNDTLVVVFGVSGMDVYINHVYNRSECLIIYNTFHKETPI